jgi:hypothetical protein
VAIRAKVYLPGPSESAEFKGYVLGVVDPVPENFNIHPIGPADTSAAVYSRLRKWMLSGTAAEVAKERPVTCSVRPGFTVNGR